MTDPLQALPQAILFDLDGTLADTAPDLVAAIHTLQQSRGTTLTPYTVLRPFASAGARGLVGAAFDVRPDDEMFEPLKVEFLTNYAAAIAVKSTLFAGVVDMLAALEARSIQWGIVTNKAAGSRIVLCRRSGWENRDAWCLAIRRLTPTASARHDSKRLES